MKIRILGCGPSIGVPSISFGFGKCNPKNPKNIRTRSAILIETDDKKNILIDTDPEIRLQLIAAGSPHIDAILYTHQHNDHMGGADELYSIMMNRTDKMPIYMQQSDADYFCEKLYYLINSKSMVDIHIVEPYKPFKIGNNEIIPILQEHGYNYAKKPIYSIGYRIGNFAYSTDVLNMEERGFELLHELDTWVLGGVSPQANSKHVNLNEALKWIERLNPHHTIFTHLPDDWDYDELNKLLPENIEPAYDGLEFIVK